MNPDTATLYLTSLVTLLAIMDPIGTVGIFIGITPGESESHRRTQALFGCIWALCLMLTFFAVGTYILQFFGITLNAVQVGGGLILLKIAFDQLSISGLMRHSATEDAASRMQQDVSIFPLAMPLLAGPGALTLMIAQSGDGHSGSVDGWLAIGGAVLTALVIVWIALDRCSLIHRMLGANGVGAITRLMGFILACIAAQMTIVGIRGIVIEAPLKPAEEAAQTHSQAALRQVEFVTLRPQDGLDPMHRCWEEWSLDSETSDVRSPRHECVHSPHDPQLVSM